MQCALKANAVSFSYEEGIERATDGLKERVDDDGR
jgi:hypothetical protein